MNLLSSLLFCVALVYCSITVDPEIEALLTGKKVEQNAKNPASAGNDAKNVPSSGGSAHVTPLEIQALSDKSKAERVVHLRSIIFTELFPPKIADFYSKEAELNFLESLDAMKKLSHDENWKTIFVSLLVDHKALNEKDVRQKLVLQVYKQQHSSPDIVLTECVQKFIKFPKEEKLIKSFPDDTFKGIIGTDINQLSELISLGIKKHSEGMTPRVKSIQGKNAPKLFEGKTVAEPEKTLAWMNYYFYIMRFYIGVESYEKIHKLMSDSLPIQERAKMSAEKKAAKQTRAEKEKTIISTENIHGQTHTDKEHYAQKLVEDLNKEIQTATKLIEQIALTKGNIERLLQESKKLPSTA